jgi:hypothetical protein
VADDFDRATEELSDGGRAFLTKTAIGTTTTLPPNSAATG